MSRRRLRSRAVVLDPTEIEPILRRAGLVDRRIPAGMALARAHSYPCADGSYTLRLVWRGAMTGCQVSISETIRGLRRS